MLLLGLVLASSNGGRFFIVIAAAWLAGANWLALKKIPPRNLAAFLWTTDLALLFLSLIRVDPGTAAIILLLLAAAAHLAIVRREDQHLRWAWHHGFLRVGRGFVCHGPLGRSAFIAGALLLLVAIAGTAWLVRRAREQNARNITCRHAGADRIHRLSR